MIVVDRAEQDTYMLELWHEGRTLSEIVEAFSVRWGLVITRSTISGRMYRMRQVLGRDLGAAGEEVEANEVLVASLSRPSPIKPRAGVKYGTGGGSRRLGRSTVVRVRQVVRVRRADGNGWVDREQVEEWGVGLLKASRKQCCYPLWGDERGIGALDQWPVCGRDVVRKRIVPSAKNARLSGSGGAADVVEADEWSSWCEEHAAVVFRGR